MTKYEDLTLALLIPLKGGTHQMRISGQNIRTKSRNT